MRAVYGCGIFLLWTILSSATANKVTEIKSGNEAVALANGPLLSASSPGQRSKRQNAGLPGDSSTYFVGLYVQRNALPGNYTRSLKVVAYRVARSTRQRNKRHLRFGPIRRPPFHFYKAHQPRPDPPKETIVITKHHHHEVFVPVHHKVFVPVEHKVYVPVHVTPAPTTPSPQAPTTPPAPVTSSAPIISTTSAPPRNLTRTQEIFNVINRDPVLAANLREEFLREFNNSILPTLGGYVDPALIDAVNRLVVVNENGITCMDVCSSNRGDTLGYGTIGICTSRFCQCDFNLMQYSSFDCYSDKVFDPISLSCKSPSEVILCNDEDIREIERPAVNTTAPGTILASAAGPSSLANLLGSLGNQNSAVSPTPASPVTPPSSLFITNNPTASRTSSSIPVAAAGQQVQIAPLQPSSIQSPNQLPSRQINANQQTIQQILQSLQLNLQKNPALAQFSISSLLSNPNSVSNFDKQQVNEPAQIFVQNVFSTPQPSPVAQQQQTVAPLTSPAPTLNSLMQSGILNESNQLSPNQLVQLAELVRALEKINQNSGTQRVTEVQTFPTPAQSLAPLINTDRRPSGPVQIVPNVVGTPQQFSTTLQQQFVAPIANPGTLLVGVETQQASEPAQILQNVRHRPQSLPLVQQQQFFTQAVNPTTVLSPIENQQAPVQEQLRSNAVQHNMIRPQSFQRQQFVTPEPAVSSIEIHQANELAQFEQHSIRTPQPFSTVEQQQEAVAPTANPKTVLALLTQSGYLNEILELSPSQRVLLDDLVRALASKNEHFGTLKEPEIHASQILPGGYN